MDCAVLRYGFNIKHDGNVILCDSGERFEVLFFYTKFKDLNFENNSMKEQDMIV